MNSKRSGLNRFYRVINSSDCDSETIDRFKELKLIIPAPWSPNQYIIYIGKGKPQWTKLLSGIKVETVKSKRTKSNRSKLKIYHHYDADECCVKFSMRSGSHIDTATLSIAAKEKIMKTNLKEVKRIAKYLEPITGLPITRNTIMAGGVKNRKFCKNGISGYHIAHYHNTEPHRICFRPMFLINPILPTKRKCRHCNRHHTRYMLTCDRKWFKLNPTPHPTNLFQKLLGWVPNSASSLTSFLFLVDCICHELAHKGTKGHGTDFQKKYILLFSKMLDDIISGNYHIDRCN